MVINVTDYKKILQLDNRGFCITSIARETGHSRTTIYRALKLMHSQPHEYACMSNSEIHQQFHIPPKISRGCMALPDIDSMRYELESTNQPLTVIYRKYAENCIRQNKKPYSLSQIRANVHDHIASHPYTLEPAAINVFLFYSDDRTSAVILVEHLPSRFYACHRIDGCRSLRNIIDQIERLIVSNNKMYSKMTFFFHLPKNMKKVLLSLFTHYSVNITNPGRCLPESLKTLAKKCSRQPIDSLYSIVSTFCNDQNGIRQSDRPSPENAYNIDVESLPTLPNIPLFEYAENKTGLKVSYGHVVYEQNFYSVPYHLTYKKNLKLIAIVTRSTIGIYAGDLPVAYHDLFPIGVTKHYRTNPEHVPDQNSIPISSPNDEYFYGRARSIGPYAYNLMKSYLTSRTYSIQGYRIAHAFLSSSKRLPHNRFEEICREANGNIGKVFELFKKQQVNPFIHVKGEQL